MEANAGATKAVPDRTRTCVWCHEAFEEGDDRQLHVSMLGAPGEFHRQCYDAFVLSVT